MWPKFQDLYQNRCSFLHGRLPAQQLDGGILKIPALAGTEKTRDKWNDESRWSDALHLKFDVAPAQLVVIYDEIHALSRSGLSTFLTRIKTILAENNAYLEPDATTTQASAATTLNMTLSGVCRYSADVR